MNPPLVDPFGFDHHHRCRGRPTPHDIVEPLPGGRGQLLGIVQIHELGVEAAHQYTRGHDERSRTRAAPGLVDAGHGTETTSIQRRLEGEPAVTPRHPYTAGTDPVHPALMSGEEIEPIRSNGRMIACTLPITFSSGTVPWNSSPMWNRESAELPRLSPITQ